MNHFEGKSVLVTGGASGIGRAAVELLGRAGACVTVADLNQTGGSEVVAAVVGPGKGRAQFVHTDVSNEDQVRAAVNTAVHAYGRLDAAINAAGIEQHWKRLHELTAAEWDFVCNINLRGMFFCLKHQIAAMLASGGGSIVAIGSIAANMTFGRDAEYCASKSGVTGLVRAAAIDYVASGIRVNAVLPGATATPLVERARRSKPKDLPNLTLPNGRMAESPEIACAAIFLLSPESSYVNGTCLTIDGGLSVT